VGGLAVGERSLICRAGGVSGMAMEGRVVAVGWTWEAPAEAIGSVRVAVVGVGVGWAELRIAGWWLLVGCVLGYWVWRYFVSGGLDVQATERFGAGSVYLVRFGRGLAGRLGASWWWGVSAIVVFFACDLSGGRSGLWDAPGDAMHSRSSTLTLWETKG